MPDLSILLFNVWNLPGWLTDGNSRGRAIRISPHLNSYDIVILNEAFVNKTELLSEATHEYVLQSLERQWFTIFDSGVIILSKYPITAWAAEHYRMRRGVDILAAKGIQFCQINVGGRRLVDIYGTHMQAGDKPGHQMARKDQAHQLANFINEHSDEHSTVVVAGDLNMGPVLDPTFSVFSNHYTDERDARGRSEAFSILRDKARLVDVYNAAKREDICRFLVRNVQSAVVTYKYDMGGSTRELSDTDAVECWLKI